MNNYILKLTISLLGACGLLYSSLVWAGDQDDDIANFLDEPISADDSLGSKDNNISYIVSTAVGKAKNKAAQGSGTAKDTNSKVNYNDGTGDVNENSVVVEAGSRVDKVYNIIIEK